MTTSTPPTKSSTSRIFTRELKPFACSSKSWEKSRTVKKHSLLDGPIKWIAGVSAGIVLTTGLAAKSARQEHQPEEIGTVRQIYDGTLYPDIEVRTFRNIDRLFPTRTVRRGTHVFPLPKSESPLKSVEFISAGKKYDMYDYMSLNRVSGLLILKDGKMDVDVSCQIDRFDSRWHRHQRWLHQEHRRSRNEVPANTLWKRI